MINLNNIISYGRGTLPNLIVFIPFLCFLFLAIDNSRFALVTRLRTVISRSSLICVISAICRKRPLFIFLHFFLLNFYFPRVILTIRESREDALKSTELSRDSSRCKARHRNMPGFVGFIYRILSNWFCGCW